MLANRLLGLGYAGLFQASDEAVLDAIWSEPGAPQALTRLAADPKAPEVARFLAAEILFRKQAAYPPEDHRKQLASVYAAALAGNFTGVANPWGLPGLFGGLVGEHLQSLGREAIPQLVPLMQDSKRVYYAGSQEATLGNSYGYRVKDLAAFYLSKIKAIPLEMDMDPVKRDQAIEKLKSATGPPKVV